jgi:hypothetical protein
MIAMADQNNAVIFAGVMDDFNMNLGHERTRRVDNAKLPLLSLSPNVG